MRWSAKCPEVPRGAQRCYRAARLLGAAVGGGPVVENQEMGQSALFEPIALA